MADNENSAVSRNRHKRNQDITLVCSWCGNTFHPWRHSQKNTVQYCSAACRSKGILARVNGQNDVTMSPIPLRIADDTSTPVVQKDIHSSGVDWKESGEHWDKVAQWYSERQAAERKTAAQKDMPYNRLASEGRSITLAGFGARLSVKQDHLIVQQGRTHSAQELEQETLYRGIHGVSSLIWLTNGGAGVLSVAALKWCASQNITIRMLTNRGEHLLTVNPSPDAPKALGIPSQENGRADIKLRRAQYALQPSGKDVLLARAIILRKLHAQKRCLDEHPEIPDSERGYAALNVAIEWLSLKIPTPATSNLDGIRLYEARASNGYFMSWRGLPLRLDGKAAINWPPQWKIIAERASPLTRWMSPRAATNPFQAMLNFCYALLESQMRAAIYAIGADPACGILHGDNNYRDSLVFDLMEELRGNVDSMLLNFVGTHTFGIGDFSTMTTGQVTIHPSLCKVLGEMVRVPQRKADDVARWFRTELFRLMEV
jgi:CRISP-associated protein Cas1